MTVVNNVLHQDFAAYPKFGVLQGVKVFVTGTNIAGPFAACLMAEMGAQVERFSIACCAATESSCMQPCPYRRVCCTISTTT